MLYYEIFNGIVSSVAASAILTPFKSAVNYYLHNEKVSGDTVALAEEYTLISI